VPVHPRMPDAAVTSPVAPAPTVFYLHGFASSDKSTKATYLADRLRVHGIPLRCPDFNLPDFASLTMTRMLNQLASETALPHEQGVTLIGSSLGGTLAILAASRLTDRIDRLVLLAPAVMFAKDGHHLLPPERIEEWRRKGAIPFFHYGHNEERLLDFAFYEDTVRYDAFEANVSQPTLIFQGVRDMSVDHRTVERFARTRPNVTLSLLDDDHQLIASLPRIWTDVEAFLGLIE
jgi:pimeloyl-ACP methyl ester carboxylesterase